MAFEKETHFGRMYPHSEVQKSIPEFGLKTPVLKSRTFNLNVARNLFKSECGGSVLWCLDCSSRAAYIDVRVNDQQRDPVRIREGFFVKGMPFSRLYISNPIQAGETITIYYAVDEEGRFDVKNPALQYTEIDVTKATVFNSLVDIAIVGAAAAVEILPLNAVRRSAIIGALATNVNTARIGDAATAVAQGAELAPGESITIETTEAIYAYNPAGANILLTRLWTED